MTNTQFELDSKFFNHKYAVLALAREILRNGPSLMTMAEAVAEAEKRLEEK